MLRLLGIFEEARGYTELLILKIPHTGGDDHLMTHHLIHSTTSLALYQMMKPHSRTAEEWERLSMTRSWRWMNYLEGSIQLIDNFLYGMRDLWTDLIANTIGTWLNPQ